MLVFVIIAAFKAIGYVTLCGYCFLKWFSTQNIQQGIKATAFSFGTVSLGYLVR